ncbi:hypothetical protein PCCS19_08030 [Paenibacillus sp. CCS19]|uniref:hypothetical protein n=1 Tax=Paenibacillus sp. CCS19 TaxID=3158387 RepID=UPI00256C5217|nr:hypothetical protein [Paenibacillus cellulosilyticus]GMK37749.1 hypothetical protein PCCS19_08030 [Paenibacillus cellulosilyticus]
MRAIIQSIGILFMVGLMTYALSAEPAEASFISRVQDIYNAPDKLNEIEQQYKDANEQLDQAQQATQELARKQEELQAQNGQLMEQNQQLMAQNAALQAEAEQAKQKKASFQHKVYVAIGVVAALFVAYFLAIRIWRHVSWRRHRPFREGGISG